jgi:hypothetical protein
MEPTCSLHLAFQESRVRLGAASAARSWWSPRSWSPSLKTSCNIQELGGSAFDGGIYLKSGFMNMATQSELTGWNVRIVADHLYWNASGNAATFDANGVVGHGLSVVLSK